jgi:hypothetical protein
LSQFTLNPKVGYSSFIFKVEGAGKFLKPPDMIDTEDPTQQFLMNIAIVGNQNDVFVPIDIQKLTDIFSRNTYS